MTDPVVVYASGLCAASVCTALNDEDTIAAVNGFHPTGIESPWTVSDEPFADGTPNGCPCPDDPTRRHLLLAC